MKTIIAFVTYETPFAPCGGVAAVMERLPGHVQEVANCETIVITPYHYQLIKTTGITEKMTLVGTVPVRLGATTVSVNVHRYLQNGTWYFLKPDTPSLFGGRRHPYDLSPEALLRDVLFFSAATAKALSVIDGSASWKLLLQDWEAAPTALAAAAEPLRYRCFLTLHNSYDRFVTASDLFQVGIDPAVAPGGTILQRSLNLVQPPIFSVSSQFAADLVEDVVQTSVLGPHLQNQLRGHLLGVDNGPFITCAVDGEVLADLRQGRCAGLEKWKHQKRQEALKAFGDLYASRDNPCWGNLREFGQHEAPWFVMAGRDDPRQKGYDVAAAAAGEFLESGGDAQFIFFPIPGDEGLAGLRFLKRLAGRFPDRVLAVPARLREGFAAALQGSSFGLMPSLYEPFGMVHEFNFNGTVGIGRATGGIIEQIVPWRAASACSTAVQSRADRWHSFSAEPTGILFRESDAIGSRTDDWALLNGTKYPTDDEDTDRLVQREHIALFGAMVRELHAAIRDGQQMVAKRPALYCRMVAEGIGYIERTFAWERAAREYVRHVVEC